MHIEKPKKKSSVILALLFALFGLTGCAPYQTYEELSDEQIITGDSTKIDKREADYVKAVAFLENKRLCFASLAHRWICTRQHGSPRLKRRVKTSELSVDATVRLHRTYRSDGCKCTSIEF